MGLFGGGGHDTVTRADKISNFQVATAEYGAPVMELLGTTRISGNVIYYDDFTAHEHVETQDTGGKGGGGSTATNITYTYTVAAILGLCEGEIENVNRIWVDKEIYTYPSSRVPLTLFKGTQDQQPWAYVVGKHPERALAYEGLAYMAGIIDLGSNAGMPNYNFEVKGKLLSTGDGTDVNPMDYIKYVLAKVGQGSTTINGEENFRSYCASADLLISTPSEATRTEEAQKIVNDIANLCGAYFFWSNDAYKIVPLADRPVGWWTPDKTIRYDLTPDDFVPQNGSCITWSRKDSSEQYNRWTVEFQNRANNYEKESVTYEDVDDIAERGVMQAPTIQARYIYTKERAVMVAENAARRGQVEKNQYKFRLGWAFCRLEPGDLVRITDEASGISNTVVMIKSIDEDANGFLSVTAVSWFQNDYGAVEYDVHEVDRPYFDFNAPPGNTLPEMFQPPADLTANGLELWLAAHGLSENWGGCTVYVSDDNERYRQVGQITNNARFGPLVGNISASATSMEVDINGTLQSGTAQDAERGNTLLWVDGECMSYATATLVQNGHYRLDGLVRGQYNTTPAAHASGSTVIRCDEALLHAPFNKEDIGKLLYIKFCSFNIFGAAEQSLADVQAYQYTLQPYYIPGVQNLTARNRYRHLRDGVHRYDVVVEWTPPELQSYLEGRVWYKTSGGQVKYLNTEMQNVPVSQMGFRGDWIFGGSGQNTVTIPQTIVGDTYRIAVTTVDIWGVETSPDASPQIDITVALKTEVPNTPDGFGIEFGESSVVSWKEVTNTDIAFYEVRLDPNAGAESVNLLARVTGLTTILTLTARTGRLFLFAYSASGKYSTPAILDYNKPAPPKPAPPTLTQKLGGFSIRFGSIPAGCIGANIYIDSSELVEIYTENNTHTFTCNAGIYDVSVAYVDLFGEGAHSDESRVVVKVLVDEALIEAQAISKAKLDTALQSAVDKANRSAVDIDAIQEDITELRQEDGAIRATVADVEDDVSDLDSEINNDTNGIKKRLTQVEVKADGLTTTVASQGTTLNNHTTQINQNAESITAVATSSVPKSDLNDSTKAANYSAIAVMQQGILSKVSATDLTKDNGILESYLSQDATGFRIKSELIQIDGNSTILAAGAYAVINVLEAGSITGDKLAANTVTANKLKIGTDTGAKMTIETNLITIYDESGNVRVRLGVWS